MIIKKSLPLVAILFFSSFFICCENKNSNTDYSLEVNKINSHWEFVIYKKQKKIIHQNHIPAINKLVGFKSKKDAELVGLLMIKKMESNIFPPSISLNELDSLNVKYNP